VTGDGQGELAIVLHTHMPYVEGFGTWPFGEEWLWEAIATCYLPLLELLDEGAPLTLSVTPVLCDQLAAPGVGERFMRFVTGIRRVTHADDAARLRAEGQPGLARELEGAAGDYERAARRFEALDRDLLAALARHASWTSAATHAVLPLCATDAGARLQIAAGIASHSLRCGVWGGGFWLPECAHAPWLQPLLGEAGVRACCVDLTDQFGLGAAEHLRPLRPTSGGPTLVPIDRATIELVWSDHGYPAAGRYRDYHRYTAHHHRPWANDGAPYDHRAALRLARAHAADFVERALARLNETGGLLVCALDTELLGHWWYEGLHWLAAVIAEAERQDLALAPLDDALTRHEPAALDASALGVSSWGSPRDLSTWDGPAAAELAFAARAAELRVLAEGAAVGTDAVRELLALQASDWAFLATRELAGDYPHQRAAGHGAALARALERASTAGRDTRNIAAYVSATPLLRP
jgi:1,4-alpha-glucan branching enzyme